MPSSRVSIGWFRLCVAEIGARAVGTQDSLLARSAAVVPGEVAVATAV